MTIVADSRTMTKRITAIALEPTRKAWSDEPYTPIPLAWVMVDEDGGEERVTITRDEYEALAAAATDETYRDGDYYSFQPPIEWGDVFAEDRAA